MPNETETSGNTIWVTRMIGFFFFILGKWKRQTSISKGKNPSKSVVNHLSIGGCHRHCHLNLYILTRWLGEISRCKRMTNKWIWIRNIRLKDGLSTRHRCLALAPPPPSHYLLIRGIVSILTTSWNRSLFNSLTWDSGENGWQQCWPHLSAQCRL